MLWFGVWSDCEDIKKVELLDSKIQRGVIYWRVQGHISYQYSGEEILRTSPSAAGCSLLLDTSFCRIFACDGIQHRRFALLVLIFLYEPFVSNAFIFLL